MRAQYFTLINLNVESDNSTPSSPSFLFSLMSHGQTRVKMSPGCGEGFWSLPICVPMTDGDDDQSEARDVRRSDQ